MNEALKDIYWWVLVRYSKLYIHEQADRIKIEIIPPEKASHRSYTRILEP